MRRHFSSKKDREPDYHKLTLDELETVLVTSLKNGLDDTKASKIRIKRGDNSLTSAKRSIIFSLVGYFLSGFCGLLWVVAFMNILNYQVFVSPGQTLDTGLLLNAILMFGVCVFSGLVYTYQDLDSLFTLERYKKRNSSDLTIRAHVIRNGEDKHIPIEEIVVGDVVCLFPGQQVPSDLRIIESRDLILDRSPLTGECEEFEGTVDCTDRAYLKSQNMAFKSTWVKSGEGKGVCVLKGDQTSIGKLALLAGQTNGRDNILENELNRFVTIIIVLALIMAIVVFVWYLTFVRIVYPTQLSTNSVIQQMVASLVTFIPSSCPFTVAVALLIIAKQLKSQHIIVKTLSIAETFSSMNFLICDKTGTLTHNRMVVVSAAAGQESINLIEMRKRRYVKSLATQQLIRASVLCNNAKVDLKLDETMTSKKQADNKSNYKKVMTGDATDCALMNFVNEYDNADDILSAYTTLAEIPFSSKNKWMMKIVRPISDDPIFTKSEDSLEHNDLMLIKGAPDLLLKKTSHILERNGMIRELTAEDTNRLVDMQNEWCVQGQRVIIVCKKMCDYSKLSLVYRNNAELENYVSDTDDWCLIGILGIVDPPREGLAGQIAKIRAAGVRVCMMTGDHALTATALAIQTGIFTTANFHTFENMVEHDARNEKNQVKNDKKALLLTGTDLATFEQDDWQTVAKYEEIVFARLTPDQKVGFSTNT